MIPNFATPHQTVTFSAWSGLMWGAFSAGSSWISFGFSADQYQRFCLFPLPDNSKLASSDIINTWRRFSSSASCSNLWHKVMHGKIRCLRHLVSMQSAIAILQRWKLEIQVTMQNSMQRQVLDIFNASDCLLVECLGLCITLAQAFSMFSGVLTVWNHSSINCNNELCTHNSWSMAA